MSTKPVLSCHLYIKVPCSALLLMVRKPTGTMRAVVTDREDLERQIATLENGDAGFAFSSGVAAIATVLAIFPDHSHFIIGDSLYSGTDRLINQYFSQHGLTFTPVDTRDLAAVEAAIRPETKAIFFETFPIRFSKSAVSRLSVPSPKPMIC